MTHNYCPNCGRHLPNHETTCPRCGAPTDADAPQSPNPQTCGTRARAKDHNKALIYLLIGLVTVAVIIIYYLLATNFNPQQNAGDATASRSHNEAMAAPTADQAADSPGSDDQQEALLRSRKRSLMADFQDILRANPTERYLLTDLNGNGFPELWITYNVGKHADYRFHVYHSEKGLAREIYKGVPGGPIAISGDCVLIGDPASDLVYRLTYDGNRVVEQGASEGYSEPQDQSVRTTDPAPLHAAFTGL